MTFDTVLQVSDPAQLANLRLKVRCGDGDSVVKDHFVLSRSEYETSWWLGNFTVVSQLIPQVEGNTLGVGAFWCQRYVEGVVDPVTSNRLFVTTSKDMRLLVGSRDHVVSLLQSLLSAEDSYDDYYYEEGSGRGGQEVFERVPAFDRPSSDFETELRRVARRAVGVGGAGLQYLGLYDSFDPSIIRRSETSSETSRIVPNMTVTLMVDARNVNASSLPMVFRCQAENVPGPPTTEGEATQYLWETVATSGFIPSEPTCLADGRSARVERRCIPSLDGGAAWGAFCAAGVCHDDLPPCEPPPAVCPEGFVQNAAVIVERTLASVVGPVCMLRLTVTHTDRAAACRSRHPKAFGMDPPQLLRERPDQLHAVIGDRPVWLSARRLWQQGPLWPVHSLLAGSVDDSRVSLDLDGNLDCVILTPSLVIRSVRCDELHVVLCVVRPALYRSSDAANGLWSRNTSLGERVSGALLAPALDRIISIAVSDSPPVLWASAADICAQRNFSLASVTSQVYRDTVELLSRSLYGSRRLKMAVNLLRRDGELRWADGTPLTYPALSPSLSMLRHHDRAVMDSRKGQYSLVSVEEFAADGAVCESVVRFDTPMLHLFYGEFNNAVEGSAIFLNVTNADSLLTFPDQVQGSRKQARAFFNCFVSTSQGSDFGYRVTEMRVVTSEDPSRTFIRIQPLVDFGYLTCGAYAVEPHGYISSNALLLTHRSRQRFYALYDREFLVGLRPSPAENRTGLQSRRDCDSTFCQGMCSCFSWPLNITPGFGFTSMRLRPLWMTHSADKGVIEHYLAVLDTSVPSRRRRQTSFRPVDEPLVPDEIESGNGERIEVDDPMLIRNWFASELVSLKPARCCPRQRTEQPVRLTWPRTCTGDAAATSLELCLDGGGRPAIRRCVGGPITGVEWGPVELGGSACAVVSNTSVSLHKLAHTPVTASNVVHTAGELERLTSSPALLVAQDIASVATTLNNVRRVLERRPPSTAAAALNLQRSAVMAVDQIMDADSAVLEAATSSLNAGPRSVRALERILVTSSRVNAPVVTGKNVAARTGAFRGVTSLSPHINVSTVRPVTDADPLSAIFGKEAALVLVDNRPPADAVFLTFRDGRLLQSPGQHVTSQVVSALIPSASAEEGPRRTVLAAFRSRPGASAPTPTCAFWDFHSSEWSTRGCWLKEVRNGSDVCTCNHLTNFARVFNYEPDIYLSEAHHRLLDVITYVGCALSLLGLVLTMLTFVLFKKWRRLRGNQIVMHLSVALTGVYLSFLGGLAAPGYHVACSCLSALLHYFLLAAFGWMAVEAVFQYLRFVRVLGTYIPGFMRKASLFAWGGALVPVICVLAVRHESYDGHADICWMDYDSFYYAFATPVLAVMVFNTAVFGMVVHALSCGRQKGLRTNQSERRQALTRLRVAFVIFVLLGLPWVFGFLAIREARFVFAILFCVCNMLQGFAIFLLMVAGERSGRELWRTLLAGKCCAGEDETSISTGAPTATTSTSSGPPKPTHVQQESRL
ncbi:uncharacterized protein LOC119109286 [Pollicipes pollicipes]|uniref:uncharacterized protein LOC119109286 n=1 Tax=Pollicipes pollicipes TaxID=41117 RepID=UPI001884DFDC|nr:uncharacterized protein LOC119109286 [Pollicipes pollicipes]XP_037088777.1 uncharacterized protein LOC119109286 [Pollicipes pollicipes]